MEACYFTQLHLQNYPKVTVLEQRGQSSTFPYRPAFETSRIAFETSSLYKCQNSKMFITAAFVLFFIKLRWPKNKSLYDTILVLIIFFYPWKSEWVDWMIHWFSKSIFLKKKKGRGGGAGVISSHAMVSKIQAQSAFLNWKAPSASRISLHYRNCHDRSMSRL